MITQAFQTDKEINDVQLMPLFFLIQVAVLKSKKVV